MNKTMTLSDLKVEQLKVEDLEYNFHRISEINPYMKEEQFEALQRSIGMEGQKVPILVYRNKVIDGRHRIKALSAEKIEHVNAYIIPNNYTLNEVKGIVRNMENRRHSDAAMRSIVAYREMIKNGMSRKEAALDSGVNITTLDKVAYIDKKRGEILDVLFNGNYVKIGENKRSRDINMIVKKIREDFKEIVATPIDRSIENYLKQFDNFSPAQQSEVLEELAKYQTEMGS